jgi:hypothetical protein
MSLMLVCTMNLYIFLAVVAVLRWKASRDLSRRVEDLLLRFSRLQSLQTSGQTKKYRVSETAAAVFMKKTMYRVPCTMWLGEWRWPAQGRLRA